MGPPGLLFERTEGFSSRNWPPAVAGIREDAFPPRYLNKPERNAEPEDFLVVASLDGAVAGYAFVGRGFDPAVCYLRELAVEDPLRGSGIGEALVREAARWLSPRFSLMYVAALEDEDFELRVRWFEVLGFRQKDPTTMHCAQLADLVTPGGTGS